MNLNYLFNSIQYRSIFYFIFDFHTFVKYNLSVIHTSWNTTYIWDICTQILFVFLLIDSIDRKGSVNWDRRREWLLTDWCTSASTDNTPKDDNYAIKMQTQWERTNILDAEVFVFWGGFFRFFVFFVFNAEKNHNQSFSIMRCAWPWSFYPQLQHSPVLQLLHSPSSHWSGRWKRVLPASSSWAFYGTGMPVDSHTPQHKQAWASSTVPAPGAIAEAPAGAFLGDLLRSPAQAVSASVSLSKSFAHKLNA